MTSQIDSFAEKAVYLPERWEEVNRAYRLHVLLTPEEEDGGYSIIALNLPGIASGGETEEEAIENIIDAFKTAVASYDECHQTIPWKEEQKANYPAGSIQKLILVNV